MKNLLYKELKLSIHPLCYVLIFGFGAMTAIPGYPIFMTPVFTIAAYSILFLGANKGQTNNDIFYTCNLPIKKSDVVKARLCAISFLHVLCFVSMAIYLLVSMLFPNIDMGSTEYSGLGKESFVALFGIILIGFSIYDLIYIPWFYKTGRRVVAQTFVGVFVFTIYIMFATLYLPSYNSDIVKYLDFSRGGKTGLLIQFGIVLVGAIFYAISRFIVYKLSSKRLEKLDF